MINSRNEYKHTMGNYYWLNGEKRESAMKKLEYM